MKLPTTLPPPTPAKRRLSATHGTLASHSPHKQIAEGAFYRIYTTEAGTVLRVSKRPTENLEEVRILRQVVHPHVNRMLRWGMENGGLCFEMEKCDFSLERRGDLLEKIFGKGVKRFKANEVCDEVNEPFISSTESIEPPIESSPVIKTELSSMITSESSPLIKTGSSPVTKEHTIVASASSSSIITSEPMISDPFSNSVVPCSTSIIISDDSSDNCPCVPTFLVTPYWVKVMMYQVSSALAHVHSKNIVHMDVKPENILVKDTGGCPAFQLCDFNIARIGEGPFSLDGDKVYMAPEILNGRCFFKSDVFSLGLVYLEIVNEKPLPTSGDEYRRLRRNNFEGWAVDGIGRRMLERDPGGRCTSKDVEEYFRSLV